jgi:hypothetical protein
MDGILFSRPLASLLNDYSSTHSFTTEVLLVTFLRQLAILATSPCNVLQLLQREVVEKAMPGTQL